MVMGDIQTLIETLQEYVRSGELYRQFQADKRLRRENHNGNLRDIQQDFSFQFLRRLTTGRFDGIHSDDVYIVRSVKNFITDYCRSRRSKKNIEKLRLVSYRGDSRDVIDYARQRGNRISARAEQTADEDAAIRDVYMIILRAASAMPEKRRRVLELNLEGVPTAVIAKALGITESTVTNHLSTAIQDILKALKEDGDLTPSDQEPHDDNT
jgi:RNA polymerase sigma factor (sigma-70 family)